MIDAFEKAKLADYFDSWELAELLQTPILDFIDAFEIEIEDVLEDLEDIMKTGVRDAASELRSTGEKNAR